MTSPQFTSYLPPSIDWTELLEWCSYQRTNSSNPILKYFEWQDHHGSGNDLHLSSFQRDTWKKHNYIREAVFQLPTNISKQLSRGKFWDQDIVFNVIISICLWLWGPQFEGIQGRTIFLSLYAHVPDDRDSIYWNPSNKSVFCGNMWWLVGWVALGSFELMLRRECPGTSVGWHLLCNGALQCIHCFQVSTCV